MKRYLFFIAPFFLGCGLLLALTGCPAQRDSGSPEKNADSAKTATPLPSLVEAEAFARSLEKNLQEGNAEAFVRTIDWSALTDRVLKGIPQTSEEDRFDRRYLIQLFSQNGGIAQSVAEKVRQGGTYHFLRTKKVNDHTLAVTFRLVDADGGLDYHDLYLERKAGSLIQIQEFYLYHFDETFSETLRRTLVPGLYVDGKNDYGMMMSELILILHKENKLLIQEFSHAFEEKNYARTLDLFEQLPRELQNLKTFQLWRLKAAQMHPDPNTYAFVLADVRQRFRQEGWIDFLSLDYFFNHREFQQALECVDRIDQLVGGDPYLENFRCWAFLNLQKPDEAKKHFEQALRQEPELAKDPSFASIRKRLECRPVSGKISKEPPTPIQPLNPFRKANTF